MTPGKKKAALVIALLAQIEDFTPDERGRFIEWLFRTHDARDWTDVSDRTLEGWVVWIEERGLDALRRFLGLERVLDGRVA